MLSTSTENFDRGEKAQRHRAWNATLKDYVLVAETKPYVEPDDDWNLHESIALHATVVLSSNSWAETGALDYSSLELG